MIVVLSVTWGLFGVLLLVAARRERGKAKKGKGPTPAAERSTAGQRSDD
jgi:hypothetical protein